MIYTGLTPGDEKRLGEILGQDLRRSSDFWKSFFIRTYTSDIYLNLEDPNDELKYLFLKYHKRVKTSSFENKAGANFLLINKEEEAKKSNLINKVRRKAMKEFDSLNSEDIKKCLRLYGHNAENMEPEVAENRLFEIIESNPQSFLDRWVNNQNKQTEYLIERAISMNIIRRNKNIYRYGSEVIGRSILEVIDFLESPKNQDILLSVMKSIESKVYIDPVNIITERDEDSEVSEDKIINLDEDEEKFKIRPKRKGDTV